MGIRGRNPISCEDVPAMDNIVAREGMEQRIVLTGMATRGNETERHRNFSESIFGSGCLRIPIPMRGLPAAPR